MNSRRGRRFTTCHGWASSVAIPVLFIASAASSHAQSFTDFDHFLQQYGAGPFSTQIELARSLVDWQQARGGFPITDAAGNVVFVYFSGGREQDVRLTGDFAPRNFFNPYWDQVGEPMTRVGSLFYLRKRFEPDARLDYRFIIDGNRALDPLNPRTIFSGTGEGDASELVMPGHRLPPEAVVQPNITRGTLNELQEPWARPRVTVYLPPGYSSARNYPTLYTADGSAWIRYIGLPTILDNLIEAKAIEPVIAVLIDADDDRGAWYHFNPDYLVYLRRVVAYVDGSYTTRARPDARVHAGTSAGGKTTAYVGFELPDVFRNLAMLSSGLSGPLYYFEPYFSGRKSPDRRLRVWTSAGTYEGSIHRETETMAAYFKRVGIPVKTVYVHQGHSFGTWRENAVEMLRYFFSASR
jgi:enterochelin esterase-like enzyme